MDYAVSGSEWPCFGLVSFQNIGSAMLVVLHVIKLQSWAELVEITQYAVGSWTAGYFYLMVYFGNFFMLNLFVAIINDKFEIATAVAADGLDVFLTIVSHLRS